MCNLGVAQWTNAAVLINLLGRGFFGDPATVSLSQRLQVCTLRFRRWCAVHGIMQSQPFITAGMLHLNSPQGPDLTLKAYHSRVFVQFLACCCSLLLNAPDGDNHDGELVLLLGVTHSLAQFHLRLEAYPRYLTTAQAQKLRGLCEEFLRCYKELATRAIRAGSLCWPLRPKLHGMQELCAFMQRHLYNVRFSHCFADESCMGSTKHVCRRVHKSMMETRTLCRLLMHYRSAEKRPG